MLRFSTASLKAARIEEQVNLVLPNLNWPQDTSQIYVFITKPSDQIADIMLCPSFVNIGRNQLIHLSALFQLGFQIDRDGIYTKPGLWVGCKSTNDAGMNRQYAQILLSILGLENQLITLT